MWVALPTLIGMTSTPSDEATDWMMANRPMPAVKAGSRRTATCVIPGAVCLRSSNHFPLKLYSYAVNPVTLPPGRDRRLTKPEPTGSGTRTLKQSARICGSLLVLSSGRLQSAHDLGKVRSAVGARLDLPTWP